MARETRVVIMLMIMITVIYLFAHFTGLEDAFNINLGILPGPTSPDKMSSLTEGHFTLLFYPSKSKTNILYIENAWKKKAEYKYVGEISKEFPPNFTKQQIKAHIIAKAKRRGSNVVVVNWLSTNYKLLNR